MTDVIVPFKGQEIRVHLLSENLLSLIGDKTRAFPFKKGVGISCGYNHEETPQGFTICTPYGLTSTQATLLLKRVLPIIRYAAQRDQPICAWLNRATGRG